MPFITAKVNISISPEQEKALKSGIGKAIEAVPGKSEASLLIAFEENCRLWLRGDNHAPMAYIEADIFANENHAGYPEFNRALTRLFYEVLHIAPENVYIKFDDIKAWGVQGIYIDRRNRC